MIGSDESLKGDTFGGIVIAAVQTTPELDTELARLGITDSKKIQDKYIPQLARLIKSKCPHAIVEYYPVEYNQHTLTQLLNDSHKAVAQQVREKLQEHNQANLSHLHKELHIVDLYPGCTVGDIRETKAESKYVCVAAASILARDVALKQFDTLSEQIGFLIPKGSTHVADALERLKLSRKNPALFVKLHFKNVKAVFTT